VPAPELVPPDCELLPPIALAPPAPLPAEVATPALAPVSMPASFDDEPQPCRSNCNKQALLAATSNRGREASMNDRDWTAGMRFLDGLAVGFDPDQ